jgi:ABC-2 type transport system permease protein
MTALGEVGENPIFLGNYLLRFLRMMILLSIWRMIYSGRGVHSGMDLNAVLTYTLISGIFAEQLDCRTTLYSSMWEGGIATRFVRPMGLFSQFITEMFGRWFLGLCLFSLPVLLCAPLLSVNPLPVSVSAGLLFILSLVLSITVGIAVDFLFGSLLMVMENSLMRSNKSEKRSLSCYPAL